MFIISLFIIDFSIQCWAIHTLGTVEY